MTSGDSPRSFTKSGTMPPATPPWRKRSGAFSQPLPVGLDEGWGLDHGTWSVLYHIFPGADIPVVQLSIDRTKPARFHYETGKLLGPLRDDGILIMGSGNLVHNLQAYVWDSPELGAFDWASRFEKRARGIILSGKDTSSSITGKWAPTPGYRYQLPTITFPCSMFWVRAEKVTAQPGPSKGLTGARCPCLRYRSAEGQFKKTACPRYVSGGILVFMPLRLVKI